VKCRACLDNGWEQEAEIQLCGFWLCRNCLERLRKQDFYIVRLQALANAHLGLYGIFE